MNKTTFGKSRAAELLVDVLKEQDKKVSVKVTNYLKHIYELRFGFPNGAVMTKELRLYFYNIMYKDKMQVLEDMFLPDAVYRFTRNVTVGIFRDILKWINESKK